MLFVFRLRFFWLLNRSFTFNFCHLLRQTLKYRFFVYPLWLWYWKIIALVFIRMITWLNIASFWYHFRGRFNLILFANSRALKRTEVKCLLIRYLIKSRLMASRTQVRSFWLCRKRLINRFLHVRLHFVFFKISLLLHQKLLNVSQTHQAYLYFLLLFDRLYLLSFNWWLGHHSLLFLWLSSLVPRTRFNLPTFHHTFLPWELILPCLTVFKFVLDFTLEYFELQLDPMVVVGRAEWLFLGLRQDSLVLACVVPTAGAEVVFSLEETYSLNLGEDAGFVQVEVWAFVGGVKLHEVKLLGFELDISDFVRFCLLKEDIAKCLFITRPLVALF